VAPGIAIDRAEAEGDHARGRNRTQSMSMLAVPLTATTIVLLAAAPGEPPVPAHEVPDVAMAAVTRRLDKHVLPSFRGIVVKLSERMPGYVVCGEVAERQSAERQPAERQPAERQPGQRQVAETGPFERFFVVVPGNFAVLDRDGADIIDKYWSLNGCR
jgi:hypothetical protein